MRPFQHFRLWLRRAPTSERLVCGVAVLLVVALAGWLLSSIDSGTSEVASTGTTTPAGGGPGGSGPNGAPGATPAASSGGASSTGGAGNAVGAAGAAGQTGSATHPGAQGATSAAVGQSGGCSAAPASGPGVNGSQVKIIVMLIDIAGPA